MLHGLDAAVIIVFDDVVVACHPGRCAGLSKSVLFDGVVITEIDGNRMAGGGCGSEWKQGGSGSRFPRSVESGNGNRNPRVREGRERPAA